MIDLKPGLCTAMFTVLLTKFFATLQPIHIMMVVGSMDLKTIKTLLGISNLDEVSRASCWQILGLQCAFIYDQWMHPGAKVQGWPLVKMWVVFVFYSPVTTHSGATTSLVRYFSFWSYI